MRGTLMKATIARCLCGSVELEALGAPITSAVFGIAEIELHHTRERQAAGIALAKQRGVYLGRQPGTTKAAPARARALRKQGLTVAEIAHALSVKQRTVYNYLSNG